MRKLLLYIFLVFATVVQAQDAPNARQARHMFDRTYQMVFGPQGSMLHYKVNIKYGQKGRRVNSRSRAIWRGTTEQHIHVLTRRKRR